MAPQSNPGRKLRWGIISTADIGVRKVIPGIQRSAHSEERKTPRLLSFSTFMVSPQSITMNGPPVHLRHMLQWQAPTSWSFGAAVKRTAPQRQPPCIGPAMTYPFAFSSPGSGM